MALRQWLPGDSGDNGDVANITVDRLLAEDVDAFIGAASSGVSLTVIDKITNAGKIQFSPANTCLHSLTMRQWPLLPFGSVRRRSGCSVAAL